MNLAKVIKVFLHAAVGACLLLPMAPTYSFKVLRVRIPGVTLHGEPKHEHITIEGLNNTTVTAAAHIARTNKNISFSDRAVGEVVDADRNVDSVEWTKDRYHFDNESFTEANKLLTDAHFAIIASALNGNYPEARRQLGTALHTLQDFYAHSTWIESNGGQSIENALLGTASFDLKKLPDTTCTFTGLKTPAPVTTGYFDPVSALSQLFGSPTYSTDLFASFPPGKCIHGPGDISSSNPFGAGINKDTDGRGGFTNAYNAAVSSTSTYVIKILTALKGQDDAICGLLGQENKEVCQIPSGVDVNPTLVRVLGAHNTSYPQYSGYDYFIRVNCTGGEIIVACPHLNITYGGTQKELAYGATQYTLSAVENLFAGSANSHGTYQLGAMSELLLYYPNGYYPVLQHWYSLDVHISISGFQVNSKTTSFTIQSVPVVLCPSFERAFFCLR